jgi:hypothetical protein
VSTLVRKDTAAVPGERAERRVLLGASRSQVALRIAVGSGPGVWFGGLAFGLMCLEDHWCAAHLANPAAYQADEELAALLGRSS